MLKKDFLVWLLVIKDGDFVLVMFSMWCSRVVFVRKLICFYRNIYVFIKFCIFYKGEDDSCRVGRFWGRKRGIWII